MYELYELLIKTASKGTPTRLFIDNCVGEFAENEEEIDDFILGICEETKSDDYVSSFHFKCLCISIFSLI